MAEAETAAPAGAEAHTTAHTGAEGHHGPTLMGVAPPVAIVSSAMLVLILIMVWKKVPSAITKGLDSSIAEIKAQLEEARTLRAEAESLRKEYADKIANAEKDAAALLDHARHEAEAIVAKAEADTAGVIARREKMARDKIAAAELAAVTELRNQAAAAAASAAKGLIAANYSAGADKAQVDQAIAGI